MNLTRLITLKSWRIKENELFQWVKQFLLFAPDLNMKLLKGKFIYFLRFTTKKLTGKVESETVEKRIFVLG